MTYCCGSVDVTMPQQIVKQIPSKFVRQINSHSVKHAWSHIAQYIVNDIILYGGAKCDFTAVKNIEDGPRYDLGAVILLKDRSLKERLLLRPPKARPVCMLEDILVCPEDISSEVSSAMKRATNVSLSVSHGTYTGKDTSLQASKRVFLTFENCKRQVLDRIEMVKGTIIDLFACDAFGFNVEDLYLVTEVIYSQDIFFRLIYNGVVIDFRQDIRWPIAFKLSKFNILYDSVLGHIQSIPKSLKVNWRDYLNLQVVRVSFIGDRERGYGDDMLRVARRRRRVREIYTRHDG
ncbi:uncharacterized protein LOC125374009 [Haliotis rufescens]|uniref:uncharacterized protein LOC125374009 n=1 Tax=Haliotis rufescens TaxID=6454 RepID=UPI00201F605E|nr:uncharacterized protein LOC125374009 [Haliotis rufescens]